MTAPLSAEEREAIQAREQAATPGPWYRNDLTVHTVDETEVIADFEWAVQTEAERDQLVADAEFVAEARTDVGRLLAEVTRQAELIDQLRSIRTLQAMWEKLGVHGMPVEKEIFGLCARDLGSVLDRSPVTAVPEATRPAHQPQGGAR